jgi:hypothetical protein
MVSTIYTGMFGEGASPILFFCRWLAVEYVCSDPKIFAFVKFCEEIFVNYTVTSCGVNENSI